MATYKYQLNLFSGASEGYVKYNITPDLGTYVAPGESVTVTGQAYSRDFAVYGVVMTLFTGQWGASSYRSVDAASKAVSIAKGKVGAFSMTFTLPAGAANLDAGASRAFDAGIEFMLADSAGLTSGSSTSANSAQKLSILKSRVAPVIGGVTFSDATQARTHFGAFVQGESALQVAVQTTVDAIDPAVSIAKRELTLGGTVHTLVAEADSLGTVSQSGAVPWSLTVTDSKGLSASASGTIALLAYAPPSISTLTAQRYREVTDDGGSVSYVQSDDGEHVRFTLEAGVASVANANGWKLQIAYGNVALTPLTGVDGATISRSDDRSLVTAAISLSERVEFTFTLTDFFHSVPMVVAVDKAGAYFDVEKHGVAVGMRATGAPDSKKFEVAEDYKSHFYGGVYGADGNRLDGVRYEAIEAFHASFEPYNSLENLTPVIARVGPMVFLDGLLRNKTAVTLDNTGIQAFILPEWARPARDVFALHQGSGTMLFWLRITPAGAVTISRYRNTATSSSSYSSVSVGSQFPVTARWIAADAMKG